jgi:UDP-N-acetylglucosamine--N-acetylmuramyl-(pentapeptide) pyrophosphoryl-undecaprenol N-acetylglucosamine transferase
MEISYFYDKIIKQFKENSQENDENNNLEEFKKNQLNLIWQTGVSYENQAEESVKNLNVSSIQPYKFIKEMDLAYVAADIIVSRAGAITISELCFVGKPVILDFLQILQPDFHKKHQSAKSD